MHSPTALYQPNTRLVDTLNEFLIWLPDEKDPQAALRLAMVLLEAADVAPQAVLAQVAGLGRGRSVRLYKQRLREAGPAGLFDRPIPGRPALTTETAVDWFVRIYTWPFIPFPAKRRCNPCWIG